MKDQQPEKKRTGKRAVRQLWIGLFVVGIGLIAAATWATAAFQQPVRWKYRIVAEYPHDRSSFTQGLIVHDGELIEGTGHYGKSKLHRLNLASGRALRSIQLPKEYFGEGIAVANGELFQLTWKGRVAFVFNPETLEHIRTVRYAGEGWGLTFDGESLVMSDGSATLRFYDPQTFKLKRRLTVREGRKTVSELNELEFIRGEVWANIWHDDEIVRIDPKSGQVLGYVDLGGLKPLSIRLNREAVYNGIAYDVATGKLYVTGKNWPKLYEIEIVP